MNERPKTRGQIYRETQFESDVKLLHTHYCAGHGSSTVCGDILRTIHNNDAHAISLRGWRSLDLNPADAAIRLLDFSRANEFPTEGIRNALSETAFNKLFRVG